MSGTRVLGDLTVKPTLCGDLVVLRPFTAEDIAAMGHVLSDPDVLRLTGSVHSTAEAGSASNELDDRTRTWYETRGNQSDRLDLAVIDKATDDCVGEVVLNEVHTVNLSCNFRTLIGPRGRDRGLGTEAARLLVAYGFDVIGFHRITLGLYTFNPRARRVYEKVGFRSEGILRESFRFDDEWYDEELMAIVRPEFSSQPVP